MLLSLSATCSSGPIHPTSVKFLHLGTRLFSHDMAIRKIRVLRHRLRRLTKAELAAETALRRQRLGDSA